MPPQQPAQLQPVGINGPLGGDVDSDWWDRLSWFPAKNVAGVEIPAFGVVRVTGITSDGQLEVNAPNADHQEVWICSDGAFVENGFSTVTREATYARYDTADGVPAIGEIWGAADGSYKLSKNKRGFRVIGNPVNETVLVIPERTLARVTGNDASPGYLKDKIVAGTGITITEQNDGADETLRIASASAGGGGGYMARGTSAWANFTDGSYKELTWNFGSANWFDINFPAKLQHPDAGDYVVGGFVRLSRFDTASFNGGLQLYYNTSSQAVWENVSVASPEGTQHFCCIPFSFYHTVADPIVNNGWSMYARTNYASGSCYYTGRIWAVKISS